jgi:hypothetical protein
MSGGEGAPEKRWSALQHVERSALPRRGRAARVALLFGCRTSGQLSGAAGERSCRGPVLDVAQAIRNPTRT